METIQNDKVIFTSLVMMFAISGVSKIYTFDETVSSIQQKIPYNLSLRILQLVILAVILLEIIAPSIIVYFSFTGKYKTYAYYSCLALAVFTLLATVLYHPPHFDNYKKSIPFWANVSLIGSLLLLSKYINQ